MTCVEGCRGPSQLLAVLQQAVADNAQLLWQEQAERQQRVSGGGSAERAGGLMGQGPFCSHLLA